MSEERWIVTRTEYRAQSYKVISETPGTVKANQPNWPRPSTIRKSDILAWFDSQASADALAEKIVSSGALARQEEKRVRERHEDRVNALIGK